MEGRAKARVQEMRELEWTLLPPGEVSQIEGITLQKDLCPIWDRIWGFQAKPDDLLVASYPKSGSHSIWISPVWGLFGILAFPSFSYYWHWINFMVLKKLNYVARNAKDTMVSYFYFQRMNKALPAPGSWDAYFEAFMAGKVAWGSWYDHVKGWWRKTDSYPVLYLFYEEMMNDPKCEIRKVMEFLGKNLKEEILDKIF